MSAVRRPIRPASIAIAALFPELPAFEPDVTFLHAIGRAGGQSARGEVVVDPGCSLALAEHALERLVR